MSEKFNPQLIARKKKRKKRFYIDNELLEEYANVLNKPGMMIYSVLSKYAHSEKQTSFPSYQTIMDESGVGNRNTVSKYLGLLEKLNIIHIKRREGNSNFYTLIDVEYWKDPDILSQLEDQNNTHIGSDTGKKTKASKSQYQNQHGGSNSNERGHTDSDTQSNINNSHNLNHEEGGDSKTKNKIKQLRDGLEEDGVIG